MIESIIAYFNEIYPMSSGLVEDLQNEVEIKYFKAGETILQEGKIARHACFVLEGLAKSYYLKDGEEVVTKFMDEKTIITSIFSFYSRKPGNEYIIALEDTTLACIHYDKLQVLYKKHLEFNYIIRVVTEQYLVASEMQLYNLRKQTAEARYFSFVNDYPYLLQRLTQKDIASYLGITTETLSRVRGSYKKK